jgi:hypothetical protein
MRGLLRYILYAAPGYADMQQGDGGGLRYAMHAMQVLRERGQPLGQPKVHKTFSALFDMPSSRAHLAPQPTDDEQATITACRLHSYPDADLLRCVSMDVVARQDWTNELLASCMRERIAFRINRTYRTHRLYRIVVLLHPTYRP